MIDHVFLDLDEVCADLMTPLARAHGVAFDRATCKPTYDLDKQLGKSQDDIWSHPTVRGSEFWATLPKTPWADDLVGLCAEMFPGSVSFLSQVVRDPWCAAGKARWVAEHFPHVPFLIGTRKTVVAGAGKLLIDDYGVNCAEWKMRGGTAVLFPAPWNELRGHHDPVGLVESRLRECLVRRAD